MSKPPITLRTARSIVKKYQRLEKKHLAQYDKLLKQRSNLVSKLAVLDAKIADVVDAADDAAENVKRAQSAVQEIVDWQKNSKKNR